MFLFIYEIVIDLTTRIMFMSTYGWRPTGNTDQVSVYLEYKLLGRHWKASDLPVLNSEI